MNTFVFYQKYAEICRNMYLQNEFHLQSALLKKKGCNPKPWQQEVGYCVEPCQMNLDVQLILGNLQFFTVIYRLLFSRMLLGAWSSCDVASCLKHTLWVVCCCFLSG